MKQGYRVMDCDIHVLEPHSLWADYLEPRYRDRLRAPASGGQAIWEVDGKTIPAFLDLPERQRAWRIRTQRSLPAGVTAEQREAARERRRRGTLPEEMLSAMEVEGIDVAIAFRTWAGHVTCIDGLAPDFAAALCRAFNRWLADFCSAEPARLKVGAQVPLHDTALAVEEARFAVRELGAVTLVLPSQPVNGRPLYDPLWEAAQDMDVAVSFHGVHASYNEHLGRRYPENLVLTHAAGQPVELMLAVGSVTTGGVLSRFPRLRAAFLEGNCSWLPWWLHALDERWDRWGDQELFEQKERPSELFARQCYISVEPEESLARQLFEVLGSRNTVVSTDWPHDDSPYPHAIEHFLALDGISDEAKRATLWDNCARLYRLGDAP